MKLVGKIETIYPVKEGINTLVISKKYKNQPRQEIAFTLFGDWEERLQEFDLGDQVEVTFQIKSKFVGDRSFTDLICRKIRLMHKTSKGQSSIDFGKS
tara:strand:- start:3902 stop:4195 length:294 start_codon:yes stop_codon:yes gene_type:complete